MTHGASGDGRNRRVTCLGCLGASFFAFGALVLFGYWIIWPPVAALGGAIAGWWDRTPDFGQRLESVWYEFQSKSGDSPGHEDAAVWDETIGDPNRLPELPDPPQPDPPAIRPHAPENGE